MFVRRTTPDEGAAMITTLLVASVITAMGMTVAGVAMSNLQNSNRDRVAGGALGAAEAGVAQGIAYVRDNGVAGLSCSPSCGANPWGNASTPQQISLADGRSAKVYITITQNFSPPTYKVGTYVIHSVGTSGSGPGLRTLEQTITAKPFDFPIGLYADTYDDAGGGSVHTEHMFSKGCIDKRSHITFASSTDPQTGVTSSIDPYYGLPPAAHSANYITDNNSCSGAGSSIHASGACNATYPSDQDNAGGAVGNPCQPVVMNSTSFFDINALNAVGYASRGLTNAQYAALKSRAQAQGNYWDTNNLGSYVAPCVTTCPAGKASQPNAVLYFKVASGTTIMNEIKAINDYPRSTCGTRSLIIVIEGGDIHINAGVDIVAAVFVPDGNLKFNGHGSIEGTIFAKTVNKFNGTADFYLDGCFLRNLPGGLFDVTPRHFREVDR